MFTFRLEAVRIIRMNKEEQALMDLGREQTVLQNHRAKLEEFRADRVHMIATLSAKEEQQVLGKFIKLYTHSILGKEHQIAILKNTIASQEGVVHNARLALAERVKERKIIDVLYDRDYASFQENERKKEQDENDEMAVLRYGGVS